MAVITLEGPEGGGARLLGPLVAQALRADYIDRVILHSAAQHLGATVTALHQKEERLLTRSERFGRFLQTVLERSAVAEGGFDSFSGPLVPPFLTEEYDTLPVITRGADLADEHYAAGLRSVMRDLAARGNVVIVGRGGSMMVRDMPNVLRVGAVANWWDCVARVMEREHLNQREAEKAIQERDQARAYYFNRFFGIDDPDKSELYHLVINTSDVPLDYAVDLVVQAAKSLDEGEFKKVGT